MSRKTSFSRDENATIEEFLTGRETNDETRSKRGFDRVWYGESDFKHRLIVKRLARGTGERSAVAWDPSGKLWGTHSLAAVAALLESGMWLPECVPSDLLKEIEKRARERTKDDTALNKRKRDDEEEESTYERSESCPVVTVAASGDGVPFGSWPTMRECPQCHVTPLLQFLECGCNDDGPMQWKVCKKCEVSWHPQKLPRCLCG